jgi:hypothetical protein
MQAPFKLLWLVMRFIGLFTLVFLLPYAAVVAYINWKALPFNQGNYYTVIADKLHMMDTVPSPKIVCIGGSASAFSVDAGQLRDSTGFKVVNAGMSAGMGYRSILTLAADHLKPGDIAVFVLEHGFYFNRQNQGNGDKTFYEFLATNPWYLKQVTLDQWINMPAFVNEVTYANYKRWKAGKVQGDKIYRSKDISNYGDMESHKGQKPTKVIPAVKRMKYRKPMSPVFEEYANRIFDDLQKRGVKVFVAYPAASATYAWKPTLDKTMSANLDAVKLGNPHEVIFDDTMFFDTDYHMRYQYRSSYNAILGHHLKNALNAKP